MIAPVTRAATIAGPAGAIEAAVAAPHGEIRGCAVICHPHPLYGGALSNKVVYTLASCATQAGLLAVRFNFRGVGHSAGAHDHGHGETDDTLVVAEWARRESGSDTLVLAGFSFGAYVSLRAAARARPALLLSVAPPFKYFEHEPLPPRPDAPWRVIHGRDDEVVDYAGTKAVLERYYPPPELVTLDGTGHFFHGRLARLREAVLPFLERHFASNAA